MTGVQTCALPISSVITGLTRKEVSSIQKAEQPDTLEELERYNRAVRVISGWVNDPAFQDREKNPARLSAKDTDDSFSELARKYSGDIPHRALLDELVRVGAVREHDDNTVSLVKRAYVPVKGKADKVSILGEDVSPLIAAIAHNIFCEETPYFQRKVFYDNLPEEALPEIRKNCETDAQSLLEKLNRLMAAHDRDRNPDAAGTGRKESMLGIYYYEDDYAKEAEK